MRQGWSSVATHVLTLALALSPFGVWARDRADETSKADRARMESKVRSDVAKRLDVPLDSVEIVSTQERTWPDSRLGCIGRRGLTEPVPVHGYRIVLRVSGKEHVYHTDRRDRFLRCERPAKPLEPIL